MKTALLFLAFLVQTAHSSNYTRAETVHIFNSWRSLIAKREPLTNMNQLVYNSDLEKAIYAQLALTGGCPDSQMIVAKTDSKIDIEIHLNVDLVKK
ncbi:hypothetical protein B9Z55_026751 [Caenorhabditis nigoni]|uniref:Cathepsin propeptide inhibitor domain-containing protein n=1 Tax=Caenorhabditis nigoni TaxID=1611254 RepID=A0A2G5SHA3_9PELO|nr:hypothetical protein B9Z55_026751 [Caenorhabditis nigoni]